MRPMNAAARNGSEYQMRRSVPTCHRMRIDSANDGGDLVGADDVGVRARRGAFPVAASRLDQAQTEEHEHEASGSRRR